MVQPSDQQVMIPDLVLFLEPYSAMNNELFLVEVKRKGNYQNNHLEDDLVKLGKEMHTALNKLILKKVKHPEVVGLKVGDESEARYQMIELSRFNFPRNNVDDVLLIPAILPRLTQMKEIIENTMNNLFESINDNQKNADLIPYTREACKTPMAILRNN
ncbi:hypothetical protein HPULCUR_011170 [Helicostylum pulchrum]|uniref:Uncharacterized protein n=1 Tax=Helicostylum pulchrum TaxID=562976 RepID=A0ABP9YFB3_9FUNG